MKKQRTLSVWSDELARARTRKKEVLEQIDRIIPWGEWVWSDEATVCFPEDAIPRAS